jgi:hypothetical protein
MAVAINLDDQPGGRAIEIDDVISDRVLSAKLKAHQSASPQPTPEQPFWKRHVPPQFAGHAAGGFGGPWSDTADGHVAFSKRGGGQ